MADRTGEVVSEDARIDTTQLPPWPCCERRGTHRRTCLFHPANREPQDVAPAVYCTTTHPWLAAACIRGVGHEGAHRTANGRSWA